MGASKKNKSKRSKVTVGFEDEIVKKEDASVILKQVSGHKVTENTTSENVIDIPSRTNTVKQKRKRKKGIANNTGTNVSTVDEVESETTVEFTMENDRNQNRKGEDFTDKEIDPSLQNELEHKPSKKLKKKRHVDSNDLGNLETKDVPLKKKKKKDIEKSPPHEDNNVDADEPVVEKKESIRAQKRRKHAELLSQKKMKAELKMQQNALNYLSKWKHSRSDWKFEKLKQIWLHQNLYDAAKVPKEFWDITVEYFAGSKGATRDTILKDALKIIEKEEQLEESNEDEDYQMKLQRARDLIQYLQE